MHISKYERRKTKTALTKKNHQPNSIQVKKLKLSIAIPNEFIVQLPAEPVMQLWITSVSDLQSGWLAAGAVLDCA